MQERADKSEDSESLYVLRQPVRINWAGISTARDVTDEEMKIYSKDPFAQEMITDPHIYFIIQISGFISLIREIGSLEEAIERIRDVCVTALTEYAGQTFLAKARGEISTISELIKKRVEDLGGKIVHIGTARVGSHDGDSYLAVSRALGDKALNPYVIPNPEIQHKSLEAHDEFLIIACDGVWDVLSNQDAVDVVQKELSRNQNNFKSAAHYLKDYALACSSTDNITVIVVNLK